MTAWSSMRKGQQHKVCVRSFFSAKVKFMNDYVKSTLQKII